MKPTIKYKFHELIDSFEDEKTLSVLYEAISEYKTAQKVDIIDELNEQQRKKLYRTIKEVKNGELLTDELVQQQIQKWLTK